MWDGGQVLAKNIEQTATSFNPYPTHPTPLLKEHLGDAMSRIKTHHMKNYRSNGELTILNMEIVSQV